MSEPPLALVGELVESHALRGQHVAAAEQCRDAASIADGAAREEVRDGGELAVYVVDLYREKKLDLLHWSCPSINTSRRHALLCLAPWAGEAARTLRRSCLVGHS